MNWADWIIVAIVGISISISALRGFIREAMSLVIWVAAFVVAMVFYQRLAVLFSGWVDTPSLRYLSAWIALFLAVLLVGSLVSYLLGQLVAATGLSGTDRLLGMLFGAARGLIVVMVILILLPGILPVKQDAWWRESLFIPYFLQFEDWARRAAVSMWDFFGRLI